MGYIIRDEDNRPVIVKGQQVIGADTFETEVKDFKDKERSFTATISRETPDRVGDVVEVAGWDLKNFRKNPVVQPFHNYRTLPVGRSLEEYTKKDRLIGKPQFAPFPEAQLMYSLYRDHYLKGFSVGFIPKKSEPIEEKKKKDMFGTPVRYIKQELLEYSVVPIPAHADALAEIKTLVKRGSLFIPHKYLRDEGEYVVDKYDDYIHVHFDDSNEYRVLYVTPINDSVWLVYGPKKDESVLHNQRFIFYKVGYTEESAVKYSKENMLKADVTVEEGVSTIEIEEKKTVIAPVTYDSEAFEASGTVLIEVPVCDPTVFGDCKKAPTSEQDEDEAPEYDPNEVLTYVAEEDEVFYTHDEVTKPFANEHACRLNAPGKYSRFARKNCFRRSEGKCIHFIFGIKAGKSEVQAMRYPKDSWEASAASSHCKDKGGSFEAAGTAGFELVEGPKDDRDKKIEGLMDEIDCLNDQTNELFKDNKELKARMEELENKKPEPKKKFRVIDDSKPEPKEKRVKVIDDTRKETLNTEKTYSVSKEEVEANARKAIKEALDSVLVRLE